MKTEAVEISGLDQRMIHGVLFQRTESLVVSEPAQGCNEAARCETWASVTHSRLETGYPWEISEDRCILSCCSLPLIPLASPVRLPCCHPPPPQEFKCHQFIHSDASDWIPPLLSPTLNKDPLSAFISLYWVCGWTKATWDQMQKIKLNRWGWTECIPGRWPRIWDAVFLLHNHGNGIHP